MHILISPIACITHIHYQYQPLHRAEVTLWFIHLIESELHSPILLDWCPVLTQINAHQPNISVLERHCVRCRFEQHWSKANIFMGCL